MLRAVETQSAKVEVKSLRKVAAHCLVFAGIFIGGIAQLVERQLCKLDVWGSNPHASTF